MDQETAIGFRGNIVGGFNRRDVISFVEEIYQRMNAFEAENQALRERCEDLEEQLQKAEEDIASAERRVSVRKKRRE